MNEILREIEETRELAYKKSESIDYQPRETLIETANAIPFDIPTGPLPEQDYIARKNIELDEESCLGRVAQAGAFIERLFPEADVKYAEVWKDRFAEILIDVLKKEPEKRFDPSFMTELLMYEEPHAILTINGHQYEPLSRKLGVNIEHPRIKEFGLWEGITSSRMVSKSNLESDPKKRLYILDKAEEICPGTTLVRENKAGILVYLDRTREAIESIEWLLERRPCARTLLTHYLLTGSMESYETLKNTYTEEIIKYIMPE